MTHSDKIGRPEFRNWVAEQPENEWPRMPLTHVTKGISAEDIIRAGAIAPRDCKVFETPLSYLFYGRPSYRVSGDGAIKFAAACPFCFIFHPDTLDKAKDIHAFDTGAFNARMYKHALMDEMRISDFSLNNDSSHINKLIGSVFGSPENYYDGTFTDKDIESKSQSWEFLAQAYLSLLMSHGRNEPDDRVGSIEAIFDQPLHLDKFLSAIVVPHIVWDSGQAPWLKSLNTTGADVLTYHFVPGRHPDYYHALLETEVRQYYRNNKWL